MKHYFEVLKINYQLEIQNSVFGKILQILQKKLLQNLPKMKFFAKKNT